jgi:putative transposase
MKQTMNPAVAHLLKRLHYPLDFILMCVRWYVAYPLSLRNLEEMMAERGIAVDHSTVHRCAIKLLPVLEKAFRHHKRPVGKSWKMDETYIRVKGERSYLYRAVDKDGNTIDFLLRAKRDKVAARRFFEKSIDKNGVPETVTIDKSGANLAALHAINAHQDPPIKISQQPRRAGPSGDQATHAPHARIQELSLRAHPSGWHRMHAHDRQRQMKRACGTHQSIADQFYSLAT